MLRWFCGILGGVLALGGLVHAAPSNWFYGLGVEGAYHRGPKELQNTLAAQKGALAPWLRVRVHGKVAYDYSDKVTLYGLSDVGVRSGIRGFGTIGLGARLGVLEARIYGASDFGAGAQVLNAGTGAVALRFGRWHVGFYGYLPVGTSYARVYAQELRAQHIVGRRAYTRTQNIYLYDGALKGGEMNIWYKAPVGKSSEFQLGLGAYHFLRDIPVRGGKSVQEGPMIRAGWNFHASSWGLGVDGHYAHDTLLGHQVGFKLSVWFQSAGKPDNLWGFRHGVPVSSLYSTDFAGGAGAGGGGHGGDSGGGGGGHGDDGGVYVVVSNEGELRDALGYGFRHIRIDGTIKNLGAVDLPDTGVTLCGGKCGTSAVYRNGVLDKETPNGALQGVGDLLRLGKNATIIDLNLISTAQDRWGKVLYVNPRNRDLGTITLKNVGVHGLVYFYQNVGRAKATYDVENLKILRRDADGKELPFPRKNVGGRYPWHTLPIPDPDGLDATTVYHRYNGSNSSLERISMPSGEGALLTIASTGDDSSLEVRKFSASLGNPDKGLVFERPLFYIYAPGKGGKKEVGPVDLKGIRMQKHNVTGSGKNYHYAPLVMIRGGGGKRVHVASLTMPAKGNTYFRILPPFINPDALYPSRATLEVIEGQVDALDWPRNHRLVLSDVFLAIAGSTPWVLLYAYDSEFGPISIRFGVTTYPSLPTSPSVLEVGLLSFVSSRLKGNVQFLSDGYGRISCFRCRGAVFVGLTGTEAHPTYVDKKVTVSATYSQLLILNDHTYFLKGFGTVQGLRGNSENGYTGKIINATMGGPLKDHHTCVEKEGFLELPVCP